MKKSAPPLHGPDADLAHRARALLDRQELPEHVETVDEGVVAVRDELAPVRAIALFADGRLHQPEVRRLPVAADDPAAVEVVDVVLVVALARQEHAECQRRVRRVGVAPFGRNRALGLDQDVAVVLGVEHAGVEALVLLLVDQHVLRRIRAEHMALHEIAQQRFRVLLDVHDAGAVRGPGEVRLDVLDAVRERLAGFQVLEAQRVLAPADRVVHVGQDAVVRRDRHRADLVEIVARGERVAVEHHLLGGLERARLAGVDRVLLAGLEAGVVPVAALAVRHGRIVLLEAGDELVVQPLLERIRVRRHRLLVGVLGLEVAEHFRARARVVAQPVVLVHTRAVRRFDQVGADGGDRRHRRGLRHALGLRPLRRAARAGCEQQRGHDRQDH